MDNIIESITEYLNSSDSVGAFLLKGEWGCGKTFFIKEVLPEEIKKAQINRIQVIISLFGLGDVKEIPFRLLNAYINKKNELSENVSEDMNRGLDYLDMKYGVDRKLFDIKLHDEDELIYNIIPRDKVYLCFDDVERFITKDNVEEIMGTINNLVENIGYKVIVISNDHYQSNIKDFEIVKTQFKEKVIGKAMTFIPNISTIYGVIVDDYKDKVFSTFMKREYVSELFLPEKRDKYYRRDFENIRNIKFAISNFYDVFRQYRDRVDDGKIVKSLKYYLAFIIGVSIEYKKGKLTEENVHGIDGDIDVFSVNWDNLDLGSERESQVKFDEKEITPDEERKNKEKKQDDAIYRRRFYRVYAKEVDQTPVFHEEIYNKITKGIPVDLVKLEDNLQKKFFDKERITEPGNIIVSQTLDGSIYKSSDDGIKEKMQTLLTSVNEGNLLMCAAYVNAFSFLDIYKTVIGKTHEELLEIFKSGFSKYVDTHEINRMESTGLEMVSRDIPQQTKDFYDFLQEELHKKWEAKQEQGIEDMVNDFKADIPKFCSLFADNDGRLTFHYINEAVLQKIPVDIVEERMHNMNPNDVHELAKFINQRFQGTSLFYFQQEKSFLDAMKRGIESINGEDTVSKIEAKKILMPQVNNALKYIENAGNIPPN